MKITEEMIRLKAYQLWETSGRPVGSAEENWFTAQNLLQKGDRVSLGNQLPPNGLRQLTSL
ncbi:MAG: DUF2934 domain-containing protein [Chromatiales bacterium]|jgi:hypothetical protein